jgi:hypothetical protein
MDIKHSGTNYDLTVTSTSSGTGDLPQSIINIIEQNTGIQVETRIMYTEIDWINGSPSQIRKYEDSSKLNQLYEIDITWANGLPSLVATHNLDEGIITNTTFSWLDGVPILITKTEV